MFTIVLIPTVVMTSLSVHLGGVRIRVGQGFVGRQVLPISMREIPDEKRKKMVKYIKSYV